MALELYMLGLVVRDMPTALEFYRRLGLAIPDGKLDADPTKPARVLEDTGLNRVLGGPNDDLLFGGTGLDFLFGNGGNDTLYRANGSTFESLDGTPLRLGAASVAVGHDLLAFVVVEGGAGIPLITNLYTEAQLGDAVVQFSRGGSVLQRFAPRFLYDPIVIAAQSVRDSGGVHGGGVIGTLFEPGLSASCRQRR